jgi:arsenite methyltransferase
VIEKGSTTMETRGQKPIYSSGAGDADPTYLDIQAEVGVSKHFGGYTATDTLHRRCHVEGAQEVLEVGCGIGVGPVYIAKRFDCRVVAVDISEKMLAWARERACREGAADRITFRQADIRDLPFEDDRFDAVIVESVLAFVEDKKTALQELMRVTRPGGYVGLNEYCWMKEPPAEVLSQSVYIGMATIKEIEWRAIWDRMPLEARTIETFHVEARQELRDRIEWIGGRSILRVWGRAIKLLLSNPHARSAIKQQLDLPAELVNAMGYVLLTGRKPQKSIEPAA